MRALNLARYPDGRWQASVQTDAHETNAFTVRVADTVQQAIAEACAPHIEIPAILPPPQLGTQP